MTARSAPESHVLAEYADYMKELAFLHPNGKALQSVIQAAIKACHLEGPVYWHQNGGHAGHIVSADL